MIIDCREYYLKKKGSLYCEKLLHCSNVLTITEQTGCLQNSLVTLGKIIESKGYQ